MIKQIHKECVEWIRDWFVENGPDCNAIVGISGGKDSTVVAALCVEALGKDRVIGVMMPNGVQSDLDDSYSVCKYLDIPCMTANIELIYHEFKKTIEHNDANWFNGKWRILIPDGLSDQSKINLPPRIRMAVLYAVAQSLNGRVANTCNLSEEYVGYSTRWGDNVGDFSPLRWLTATQVVELGHELGLPKNLIDKAPADGLTGKTDEDVLGFTYKELDEYIETGRCENKEAKEKIDRANRKNRFKNLELPSYQNKELLLTRFENWIKNDKEIIINEF